MYWLEQLQTQATEWGVWSYLLLALLVAVEGPIATLVGAAAAAGGAMRLPFVFAAAAAGNLLADSLWFLLGYYVPLHHLLRFGRWLGVTDERLDALTNKLRRNTPRVLIAAKLTAGLVIPALISAGLIRASWRRWFAPVFVAEMLWTGTLVVLGFHATAWIARIQQGLRYFLFAGSAILVIVLLAAVRRTLRNEIME